MMIFEKYKLAIIGLIACTIMLNYVIDLAYLLTIYFIIVSFTVLMYTYILLKRIYTE